MLVVHRGSGPLVDNRGPRVREVQGASTAYAPFGVLDAVTWALFPTLAGYAADAVDRIRRRYRQPPLV